MCRDIANVKRYIDFANVPMCDDIDNSFICHVCIDVDVPLPRDTCWVRQTKIDVM